MDALPLLSVPQTNVVSCPKCKVGRVIGQGGQTIKALQQYSGAIIQIDQSQDPTRVTIAGDWEAVDLAAKMIKVSQEAPVAVQLVASGVLQQLSSGPARWASPPRRSQPSSFHRPLKLCVLQDIVEGSFKGFAMYALLTPNPVQQTVFVALVGLSKARVTRCLLMHARFHQSEASSFRLLPTVMFASQAATTRDKDR